MLHVYESIALPSQRVVHYYSTHQFFYFAADVVVVVPHLPPNLIWGVGPRSQSCEARRLLVVAARSLESSWLEPNESLPPLRTNMCWSPRGDSFQMSYDKYRGKRVQERCIVFISPVKYLVTLGLRRTVDDEIEC
ncbi:hypothetical protein CDAR_166701 [Caerostris darwini]|uniref:Uncharacterized protein n=1 Tax=Caerostris darwini TaxID=1538125 RepID=A0AAV4QPA1_9ARAC|nr:hypothetical protein CDAR_166701 [Caerostris darwini]